MARAIIKNDVIIKLTIDPKLGIEIGKVPRGVNLSRLRWDGEVVIDLFSRSGFWVDKTRRLHIFELPGCVWVKMKYSDRNKLIVDSVSGVLRVKTQEEIEQPKFDEYKARRVVEYPTIGDQLGAILGYLKTLPSLPEEITAIISDVDAVKEKWPKPDQIIIAEVER